MDVKKEFRKNNIKFALLTLFVSISLLLNIQNYLTHNTVSIPNGRVSNIVRIRNGDNGINAKDLIDQIELVLPSNPDKIIIEADSNGGRMAQGEMIYNYIANLKVPVHVYIQDSCLSACYYGISSSDKIFAYKSSVVGNIGVTHPEPTGPFKVFAWSGKYKNPESQNEFIKKHMTASARVVHLSAINDIKKFRGKKLTGTQDQLFEGLIWTGIDGKRLGLIDELI